MSDARDRQEAAEALDADWVDEPRAERVLRERPDPLVVEAERRAGLPESPDDHLVLVDDEDNDSLTAGAALGEQSAEEAAMHVIEDE